MSLHHSKEASNTQRSRGRIYRSQRLPASLLIPASLVALAMLVPLFYLVLRAAGESDRIMELLLRERTWQVLWNTLLLAVAVTGSSILIAVPTAWLTVRTDLPMRRFWSVITMLPLAIPSLVGGFAFVATFGYGGILHELLLSGSQVVKLPNIYGFAGAWILLTLLNYPYVLIPVRAALRGSDPSLEEVAQTLKHTGWELFTRVILPQLRPAITSGALLVALYTLSDFAAVSMLRFDSFTRVIYTQYQASFNRTYAALLALVLVAITLLIVFGEARLRGRAAYYRIGSGAGRKPLTYSLGKWRWLALPFLGALTAAAVVLPTAVAIFWIVRGVANGEPFLLQWDAFYNSLYASGLAAGVTLAAALPIAILSIRYPSRVTGLIERLSYAGYALPGVVVALSLVFVGANYVPMLYQTMYLLLFAYVVLFLPQALGSVRTSLLQVSPNVERAARSLGYSPARVVWRVTLPLIRPGMLAGALMVFLTAMKELPATLLLSPIGFRTLSTQIWSAASEAYYTRAAVPALLLIVASSLSVGLLLWQERKGS